MILVGLAAKGVHSSVVGAVSIETGVHSVHRIDSDW